MVISEEEYNKKHRRYRLREMGPYQWEKEIKVGYLMMKENINGYKEKEKSKKSKKEK